MRILIIVIIVIGLSGCTFKTAVNDGVDTQEYSSQINEEGTTKNGETAETSTTNIVETTETSTDSTANTTDASTDSLEENHERNTINIVSVYTSYERKSEELGQLSIESIEEISFLNIFEIINRELHGWYMGKDQQGSTLYFHKVLNDAEIPVYSGINEELDIQEIEIITDVGIIALDVGKEASYIKVKSEFSQYGYFAIVDRYEEPKWSFINVHTGIEYYCAGNVSLSPNGLYFFACNPYGHSEGRNNSIGIYAISFDEITCAYSLESNEWSPDNESWESEDLIRYSEVYYSGILREIDKTVNILLEYDGKVWKRVLESE